MKRCSVRKSVRLGPEARLTACLALWLATSSLPVLANQDGGGAPPLDSRLSATLVGRLEPGAQGRLAVHWNGPDGSLIDVWVDLDGDGDLGSHELVVGGRPLTIGIEVLSFELPAGEPIAAEPKVWVRTRARGWCDGAAAIAAVAGGDGSGCAWQPGFEYWRLEGSVAAMIVWDDGSGSALYVAGSLWSIGALQVNNIARWDGAAWSALSGPSGAGVNGTVRALAVFDDGTGPALYVGGQFSSAGGTGVHNIARWDGTDWSDLIAPSGSGIDGSVWALTPCDDGTGPALFAGGQFTFAGGARVNNIARWDGSGWSALSSPAGTGVNSIVRALTVFDDGTGPVLLAGGGFTSAGGVTVNHIARWNGSEWSSLSGPSGTGVDRYVYTLAVFYDGSGPALYAGGLFSLAGGVTVNHVARWDGSAWSALSSPAGTGVDGWVYALAPFDDGSGPALYAGGWFVTAGGVTANNLARWDGATWSALSGPAGTGVDSSANALAAFDDGRGISLFAGGDFDTAGGVLAFRVARWAGGGWTDGGMQSFRGMDGPVRTLAVYDDGTGLALYAGGDFDTAGGVTANSIARWDGLSWSFLSGPSGMGVDGSVEALAVYDDGSGPALYAGGWFETAGDVTVNSIARWDGDEWSALSGPSGTGVDGSIGALAVFDDGAGAALYAGGGFWIAGGETVQFLARWNGHLWSALGTGSVGLNAEVGALAVFGDGAGQTLYAGGSFSVAGGHSSSGIAAWRCSYLFADGFESGDSSAWSAVVP